MGAGPTDKLNTVKPTVANLQVKLEAKKSLFMVFYAVILLIVFLYLRTIKVC